jgi:hypothetical protein
MRCASAATGLAAEVAAGEAQADGVAFADAKQVELLALVKSAQATLARCRRRPRPSRRASAPALTAMAAGADLATGTDDYSGVWDAKKELVTHRRRSADAKRRDAALAQAQRDEPARFDRFGERIAALDPLLQATACRRSPRSARSSRPRAGDRRCRADAPEGTSRGYTTQARFAVAQLYDRANIKKDADHAQGRRASACCWRRACSAPARASAARPTTSRPEDARGPAGHGRRKDGAVVATEKQAIEAYRKFLEDRAERAAARRGDAPHRRPRDGRGRQRSPTGPPPAPTTRPRSSATRTS